MSFFWKSKNFFFLFFLFNIKWIFCKFGVNLIGREKNHAINIVI